MKPMLNHFHLVQLNECFIQITWFHLVPVNKPMVNHFHLVPLNESVIQITWFHLVPENYDTLQQHVFVLTGKYHANIKTYRTWVLGVSWLKGLFLGVWLAKGDSIMGSRLCVLSSNRLLGNLIRTGLPMCLSEKANNNFYSIKSIYS